MLVWSALYQLSHYLASSYKEFLGIGQVKLEIHKTRTQLHKVLKNKLILPLKMIQVNQAEETRARDFGKVFAYSLYIIGYR